MKISQKQLRAIIMEELVMQRRRKSLAESKKRLAEGSEHNPLKITPEYLNSLIKEEYAAFQRKQYLAESRRRQRASRLRRRRR